MAFAIDIDMMTSPEYKLCTFVILASNDGKTFIEYN